MIGYPSGQDGAILPARDTGFVPQVHRSCFGVFSHIINPCSVKMAGYCPRSFFACLWTSTKELGQYPAILTSCLVNNPYVSLGSVHINTHKYQWTVCLLKYFLPLNFRSTQVVNFTKTFYAPPVVIVTANHQYNSSNANAIKPENNVINAWIEVS